MNKIQQFTLVVIAAGLASCGMNNSDTLYTSYIYKPYGYDETQYYSPQTYRGGADYNFGTPSSHGVTVPDSYHVGAYHSPTPHKDRDKHWVQSQNPQGYTIEIADEEKAASVARKLYQVPKNDRAAEIQYQKDGKPYYKGVYGTFNTQDEAIKALENLPESLKKGAGVRNWGAVQQNSTE